VCAEWLGFGGAFGSFFRFLFTPFVLTLVLKNPSKHGFLIADAGGGTLDISAYAVKGTSPLTIEEIAPPDCIFAGSVFVSRRAREFLEGT
jgi:hypothetical protein